MLGRGMLVVVFESLALLSSHLFAILLIIVLVFRNMVTIIHSFQATSLAHQGLANTAEN